MTIDRAKTIEMAREADCAHVNLDGDRAKAVERLERFAALVRAQVIEEAAQVCEALAADSRQHPLCQAMGEACAAALRGMKSDSVHPAAADACASTAPLPEGWVMVPAMPTKEMVWAAYEAASTDPSYRSHKTRAAAAFDMQRGYRAMLAAAPAAPHSLVAKPSAAPTPEGESADHAYRLQTDRHYKDEVGKRIEETLRAAADWVLGSTCGAAPGCPCFDKQGRRLTSCWFAAHAEPNGA